MAVWCSRHGASSLVGALAGVLVMIGERRQRVLFVALGVMHKFSKDLEGISITGDLGTWLVP